MTVLILVHAWLRWGLLALGLFGLLRALGAASRGDREAPRDRAIGTAFLAALDTQWLLGVILLVALHLGEPAPAAWFHGALMTVVVAATHVLRVRLKRVEAANRRGLTLAYYAVPLLLILLGHLALPRS